MSKTKTKISLFLAIVVMMCMSVSVFAEDAESISNFEKVYTVTGGDTLPTETLSFTVTATEVPAAYTGSDATSLLTVGTVSTSKNTTLTDGTYTADVSLSFNVEDSSVVYGKYYYTITETTSSAQGASSSDSTLYICVYVTYDDDGNLQANIQLVQQEDEEEKDGTINNEYALGTLTVSKTVTGGQSGTDYGDFTVTVTFTSTSPVMSTITYTNGTISPYLGSDDTGGWTYSDGTYTAIVTLTVSDGDSIVFEDIPEGVTYTVAETQADGFTTSYSGSDGSDGSGTISSSDTDTVAITNNVDVEVDTGIVLSNVMYIAVLLVIFGGIAFYIIRKKKARS